jgi:aminoglycoside phosphotransferase (APT) family kinase protein
MEHRPTHGQIGAPDDNPTQMTADLVEALRRLFGRLGVPFSGDLHVEVLTGGRSNLTYKVWDDDISAWVVRRPPTAGLTPSAHDVVREYTIMEALQSTSVPVPPTVGCDPTGTELGAPTTVVQFVRGRVVRDRSDFAQFSDSQARAAGFALADHLAKMHAIDYRAVGLTGRPIGFLNRQITLWAQQWARVKTRDLADAETLYARLSNTPSPDSHGALIHGDFRIDNTILDPDHSSKLRAIVDWELSTIGDPLTDIALMCVYRQPAFDLVLGEEAAWTSPRLPTASELAERYAKSAGCDLAGWNFYLALANFKVAVIAEGIAYRARQGSAGGDRSPRVAEATREFMAAGLRALGGASRG